MKTAQIIGTTVKRCVVYGRPGSSFIFYCTAFVPANGMEGDLHLNFSSPQSHEYKMLSFYAINSDQPITRQGNQATKKIFLKFYKTAP
jgi:hypothetical protein